MDKVKYGAKTQEVSQAELLKLTQSQKKEVVMKKLDNFLHKADIKREQSKNGKK